MQRTSIYDRWQHSPEFFLSFFPFLLRSKVPILSIEETDTLMYVYVVARDGSKRRIGPLSKGRRERHY